MSARVSAIILAAGAGRRYGGRKMLALIDGQPMIRVTAERVTGSVVDQVVVILGADAAEVRAALAGLPVRFVTNDQWRAGHGVSIGAGVHAVRDSSAVVIVPGDQPGTETALIDRLVGTYRDTGSPIVVPEFAGEQRPPVLFDRSMFPELLGLDSDRGARQVVDRHRSDAAIVAVPGPAPRDIDTVEDYRAFLTERGRGTV